MAIYILSRSGVKGAIELPLIMQLPLKDSLDLEGYDYLIFTSKNGVKIAHKLNPNFKKIPILAIGKATAKAARELGAEVAYVAKSFYGEDFAKEIAKRFERTKRYLLLRGKKSLSDIKAILAYEGFSIEERIIYETRCVDCASLQPPQKGATIIFSSPSTIECFFRCFRWDLSYKAVVIGAKTASFMPPYISYRLFSQKSLQEIVDIIGKP